MADSFRTHRINAAAPTSPASEPAVATVTKSEPEPEPRQETRAKTAEEKAAWARAKMKDAIKKAAAVSVFNTGAFPDNR